MMLAVALLAFCAGAWWGTRDVSPIASREFDRLVTRDREAGR